MQYVDKISIALPKEMTALVRQVVEAGEYSSTSEVIREALRDWNDRREQRQKGIDALRALVEEAIHDPRPPVSAEETLNRLRAKYRAIAEMAVK